MRLIPILCALLVASVPLARAQDQPADVDSLSAHFDETLERARGLVAEGRQASGEDSLVVMLRVEEEVAEAARTLRDLATTLRAGGLDSPVDAEVADDFRALAEALWAADARVQERLALTRQQLFRAEGRERLRLERELADRERRLNGIHRYLQEILDAMASLGLPVADDRARLVARLEGRAEDLVGRIQLLDQELETTRDLVRSWPDDTEFARDLELLRRRSALYVESLDAAVARLRALGQPTARYQNVVVSHTGELARGLFDPEVAGTMFRSWWATAKDWFADNGVQVAIKAIIFFVVMGLSWLVARGVRRAVRRAMDGPRVRVSNLLRKMLIDTSGNLVLLAGFLLALSQVGANLAPVLAGVGVAGFIVGFALQETLSNFAAGMMILFYRPYDVGDFVEVSGVFGKVDQMSLVSTTILTIDNQTLVVPNGKIWGDVIRNVTAQRVRRVDLEFGISYSSDIPRAEEVLLGILRDHPHVLSEPEPMVKLFRLNESSVDFVVRPWVKTEDYWDVYWDVTREVKLRFDAEGIAIPFPQRDVHHYVGSPEFAMPAPRASTEPGHGHGVGTEAPPDAGSDD